VCPDEPALRKAVAARVGYDPFFPWAEQTVVVQIGITIPTEVPATDGGFGLVPSTASVHYAEAAFPGLTAAQLAGHVRTGTPSLRTR
jgi:hypothetical protein